MSQEPKYEALLEADEEYEHYSVRTERFCRWHQCCLYVLLVSSVFLNAFQYLHAKASNVQFCREQSNFAKISYEGDLPWYGETPYNSGNLTEMDKSWGELLMDDGLVALSKEWAMEQGIPPTTSFPWDNSKGIYLLNGFHGVHCLNQVYFALKQYRDGIPQSLPFEHSAHCLDWIRNDIMCRADDTPLYLTSNEHGPQNGVGQMRQCKDWSKMVSWARENTACFRYGTLEERNSLSQIARYKYCPKDSPYLPTIRSYLNKSDDWFPTDEDIVTMY